MRSRDYKSEYERRIALGKTKGLSRAQARGHAKASEPYVRTPKLSLSDERVQAALRVLRQEHNIAIAARSAKISPERLRKFAVDRGLIEKEGRRWRPKAALPRRMPLFSKGRTIAITVSSAAEASKVGRYMSTVGHFLETNRVSLIAQFEGDGVRDITGKFHLFEKRPNTLYRLGAGGEASFEHIYRIVI